MEILKSQTKYESTHSITTQFRPLLQILVACSPYRVQLENKGKVLRKLNVSLKRPFSLYPYFLLLWSVLAGIIFAFNVGLGVPIPFRLVELRTFPGNGTVPVSFGTNKKTMVFTGLTRALEVMVIFANSPTIVSWLEGVEAIEICLSNLGKVRAAFDVDISTERNFLLAFYVLVPTLVWILGQWWLMFPHLSFQQPTLQAFGWLWFLSWSLMLMSQTALLEDAKMVLMLITLGKIYKRTLKGMQEDFCARPMTVEKMQAWKICLTMLRRQVESTGEYMKTQLLISLAEVILCGSTGLYMVLRFIQPDADVVGLPFVIISIFYCLLIALRLYLKVYCAEQIYREESRVSEYLLDIEGECMTGFKGSAEVLAELRHLQHLLQNKPAKVNLGNYAVLDKNLLIQVLVQTVTMLIAVAQFHSS